MKLVIHSFTGSIGLLWSFAFEVVLCFALSAAAHRAINCATINQQPAVKVPYSGCRRSQSPARDADVEHRIIEAAGARGPPTPYQNLTRFDSHLG